MLLIDFLFKDVPTNLGDKIRLPWKLQMKYTFIIGDGYFEIRHFWIYFADFELYLATDLKVKLWIELQKDGKKQVNAPFVHFASPFEICVELVSG